MGRNCCSSPTQITVGCSTGPDAIFSTQETVEAVAADHLTERMQSAHSVPISAEKLLDDVGFLVNTLAVQEILRGTYVYPENMDY